MTTFANRERENGDDNADEKASHFHYRSAYVVGSSFGGFFGYQFRNLPFRCSFSPAPPDGISKVLHRGRINDEEVEDLLKMKPCSRYKLKNVTGNCIFVGDAKDGTSESCIANLINKTRGHNYQQASNGMSQISFSAEESISPKKPTSLPEVVKQRELSGTLISELDPRIKKQISDIKCKELNGHDIFIGPPKILPRSSVATHFLESKKSKDMEEPVPRCTLSRFLILLKTRVISYLVKNLCIESINGWFGYRSVEFINPKEGEGGTKKEVSLFSMKLHWALFLASALPTPWHHFSYL